MQSGCVRVLGRSYHVMPEMAIVACDFMMPMSVNASTDDGLRNQKLLNHVIYVSVRTLAIAPPRVKTWYRF